MKGGSTYPGVVHLLNGGLVAAPLGAGVENTLQLLQRTLSIDPNLDGQHMHTNQEASCMHHGDTVLIGGCGKKQMTDSRGDAASAGSTWPGWEGPVLRVMYPRSSGVAVIVRYCEHSQGDVVIVHSQVV